MKDDAEQTPGGRPEEPRERILNGFPIYCSGGGRKITHELVKRLLDEEDEEEIARARGGKFA